MVKVIISDGDIEFLHPIPQGWTWSRFDDIGIVNPRSIGKDLSDDSEVTFVPMRCVAEMGMGMNVSIIKKHGEVKKGYTPFIDGDLLIAKITPCMENGKVVIAERLKNCVGFGSTEFHTIRFHKEIVKELYYYYFLREDVRKDARSHMTGTAGQLRVPSSFIQDSQIPLPPLPEQHRIVTKIEELFTQLDAGVASLKKAQAQLKRYRQAVLKAAFEGRLTQEWREEHKGEVEPAEILLKSVSEERQKIAGRPLDEFTAIDTSDQPSLPSGWIWCRLPELSWDAGYGTSVKCDYGYDGYPVLRIPNIVNGTIDLSDLKYAPKSENENIREFVDAGDLLIIRTNGSIDIVGKSALVKSKYGGHHSFASYLIRYRLVDNETLQNWISMIWYSPFIRKSIVSLAATTAGQYNVSLSKLNTLVFPLPPQQEQQQIISEVERCLSIADKEERIITTSLRQAESLRQSILKRAFEGKLVPQDPSDEPASVLLERIKAEKAKTIVSYKKKNTPKSTKSGIKT